jgi:hypothetical protein
MLKPNDSTSLEGWVEDIHRVGRRNSALGKPLAACFTRQNLERRLCVRALQPDGIRSPQPLDTGPSISGTQHLKVAPSLAR